MKLKSIKYFGFGLVASAALASAASASVVYTWVESSAAPPTVTTSGTLTDNGGILTGSYTETSPGFAGTITSWSSVTPTVLGDGNLQLSGLSAGLQTGGTSYYIIWSAYGASGTVNENLAVDSSSVYGDWVPVPEASTMIFGGLLLLPFGLITSQSLRKIRRMS